MFAQCDNSMTSGCISVIIPVYNGEAYIGDCISSLLRQTLRAQEIIIINDGSTDKTLEIINEYASKEDYIKIVTVENGGQGKARNIGLGMCEGDYVLFLDADDFVEPETLEYAFRAAMRDDFDFVVFDWKYFYEDTGEYRYLDCASFFDKEKLEDDGCLVLLRTAPIFSVNKLYSKKYLNDNGIRYGEGHIYEDIPFWIKVCIKARKVSLIHNPLYCVRVNSSSTTKINYDTDKHSTGYIKALEESLNALNQQATAYTDLNSYFVSKFISYYTFRTPERYQAKFLKDFVDLMSEKMPHPEGTGGGSLPYRLCIKYKVFENKRYSLMKLIALITGARRKMRKNNLKQG